MNILQRNFVAIAWFFGLWLLFVSSSVRAIEAFSIEAAIAEALAENPSLAAIQARAEALQAIPEQKGTLPDPKLSANMMNLPIDSFSFTQENMTQLQVGISQALPYPGKLRLRQEVAQAHAEASLFTIKEWRLKLARDVKISWWNLYFLNRSLEIIGNNQELLRQFVSVAQTKYTVGKGLQQEVLLAQLELSKLLDTEITLKGARRNEIIRLNTLLNRPVLAGIELRPSEDKELRPLSGQAALISRAMQTRPQLASQQRIIDASRLQLALAKKDYFPDFNVGAGYGFRGGKNPSGNERADFLSLMFSMNLPLWTAQRQDNQVDQRSSEVLQQKYRLKDQQGMIAAEIGQHFSDYQRSKEKTVLFKRGIIPQARQTVASMLSGYQVNKVDFLNLVRSQITLYNYEIQYWKALSQAQQSLAQLVAAVGEENIYE